MTLKISLRPHEKCIVGGAAIQNGDKPSSFIVANQTVVLREKHVMTEEKADTLAKQIYFLVQTIYLAGGIDESRPYQKLFFDLIKQFLATYPGEKGLELVGTIGNLMLKKNDYSALMKCRELIEYEANYLAERLAQLGAQLGATNNAAATHDDPAGHDGPGLDPRG